MFNLEEKNELFGISEQLKVVKYMDKEKVIKALEDSLMDKKNQGDYSVRFSFEVVEIIITLLKEQEKEIKKLQSVIDDLSFKLYG